MIDGYMQDYVLLICLSLLGSPLFFAPIRKLARLLSPTMSEDESGSIASAYSLLLTFAFIIMVITRQFESTQFAYLPFVLIVAAILGSLEDYFRLPSQFTIPSRLLIATICYLTGFGFSPATTLQKEGILYNLLVDYPITVLFYLGIITSINLFDKLKGLATGVTVIVALSLFGLLLRWSLGLEPVLMVVIAGACLGHLLVNQWDRRIRLGTAGQFVVAIMLAATTVSSRAWSFTLGLLFIPLLAVIVPMVDKVYSVILRLSTGKLLIGTDHLRSMLLEVGFTERWVIFAVWIAALQVGVLVNVVYIMESLTVAFAGGLSLAVFYLFILLFLTRLGDRLERKREPERLRIIFISHYYHPEVNAPASRLKEHVKRWTDDGHEVTVITTVPTAPHGWPYRGYTNTFWREEIVDGARIIRVWTFIAANKGRLRRSLNYLSFMGSSLLALLFLRRHDILISTTPQFFSGFAGAIASLFRKEKFVLEVRDIWPESIIAVGAGRVGFAYRVIMMMASWMYRRAALIVTVGEGYRDKLLENKSAASRRISVIPNGVDFDLFDGSGEINRSGLLTQHDVQDRFVVSYVGTVGMAHGLDVVLAAAEILRDRRDIHFVIAGDGADLARLNSEATTRGLSNVLFLGLIPKEKVPVLIRESSACLVHLKKTELFKTVMPSKLFEAMGMARPVLLGVRGHAEELLAVANAGISFEPENAEEFARAIERLSANHEMAEIMGLNGLAFVRAHQSRDRFAREYIEELRRLIPGDLSEGDITAVTHHSGTERDASLPKSVQ